MKGKNILILLLAIIVIGLGIAYVGYIIPDIEAEAGVKEATPSSGEYVMRIDHVISKDGKPYSVIADVMSWNSNPLVGRGDDSISYNGKRAVNLEPSTTTLILENESVAVAASQDWVLGNIVDGKLSSVSSVN